MGVLSPSVVALQHTEIHLIWKKLWPKKLNLEDFKVVSIDRTIAKQEEKFLQKKRERLRLRGLWVWPSHQQWCHVEEDLWLILA